MANYKGQIGSSLQIERVRHKHRWSEWNVPSSQFSKTKSRKCLDCGWVQDRKVSNG